MLFGDDEANNLSGTFFGLLSEMGISSNFRREIESSTAQISRHVNFDELFPPTQDGAARDANDVFLHGITTKRDACLSGSDRDVNSQIDNLLMSNLTSVMREPIPTSQNYSPPPLPDLTQLFGYDGIAHILGTDEGGQLPEHPNVVSMATEDSEIELPAVDSIPDFDEEDSLILNQLLFADTVFGKTFQAKHGKTSDVDPSVVGVMSEGRSVATKVSDDTNNCSAEGVQKGHEGNARPYPGFSPGFDVDLKHQDRHRRAKSVRSPEKARVNFRSLRVFPKM